MEQTKIREHKIIDAHPIAGSFLFTFCMYFVANLVAGVINVPLNMFLPGYPPTGPIGILAAFFAVNLIYCRWFRPDAESLLKGDNVDVWGRFFIMFIIYWILSEAFAILFDGVKLALPSYISVFTAISAGFIEELIFRGMLVAPMLRKGLDRKRVLTALLVSSAVFGLVHGANVFSGAPIDSSVMQVLSSFALGIVFGAMLLTTGNLWLPVLLHTLHDILAFSNVGETTETGIITHGVTLGTYVDLALCVVLAVYTILYLKKEPVMERVLGIWKGKWSKGAA